MTASGVRVASMSSTAVSSSASESPEAAMAPSASPKKPSHAAPVVQLGPPAQQHQENQTTTTTATRPHPIQPQPQPPSSTRPAAPVPHHHKVQSRSSSSSTSSSPSSSGSAGETVGDYALGETIGKGTFGKVKLGLHLVTGEKVAIKILEKKRIVEIADVERVAREIKILKRIRHVNVIQLFEVIDSPERIFLIMEYVDSGEMFEYIVAHHRIREPEAVVLFQQIVDGLDYLHANEVTHRDLKPENLLLQSCPAMPSGRLVKIVDFGLSNTHDNGRLLRTACGSPCYAAPEMIQGKLYKGPLADIWSLGVVLFAMVCGYLPFEDSNTNLLYKKILSADYKLPPFLSHAVQDLIRKILETNPEKRFTAEMIRQHPWFTSARASIPRALTMAANCDDVRLRNHILGQLETIGLDPDDVLEALKHKVHNSLTASFYLLYNKLLRLMKDQPLGGSQKAPPPQQPQPQQTQPQQPPVRPVQQPQPPSQPQQSQPATGKSNGTPRRPELTADEIRSSGIRTKESSKAPPSSSTSLSPPSTISTVPVTRRQSDGVGLVTRPPSSSSRHHVISSSTHPPTTGSHGPPLSARRPSSVRSGRNLVLLTNGGHAPAGSSNTTTHAAAPQRPQIPSNSSLLVRPPSQGSHNTKVSISNGMVALSPLAAAHSHRRPEPPSATTTPSRRQTIIVPNTSQSSGGSPAAAAALLSTASGSQAIMRRRVTTAVAPQSSAAPHSTTPVLPVVVVAAPAAKDDDTRLTTAGSAHNVRIHQQHQPHRTPQPPPGVLPATGSSSQFTQLI